MKQELAKLDIQKHIYIGKTLFPQIMRGLKIGNNNGDFLAKNTFEVIYNEIKNYLDKKDSIILLLKMILSKKKNMKDLELVSNFFALLEADSKLLNSTNKTLYKLEEEEDFYFGNK